MFDLLLITYDFPFGTSETFLETEIKYASRYFSKIYIISLSKNKKTTRELPLNVIAYKINRYYHFLDCLIYSIGKCFSKEARNEYRDTRLLRNKPKLFKMIKSWIITWMIDKRLFIAIKELHLNLQNTVAYSYWLSASAYFLSRQNNFKYRLSRVHGFEVRDCEDYIAFRNYMDAHLDEIVFISEYTQNEYNEILKYILLHGTRAEQIISRLGVEEHGIYHNRDATNIDTLILVSCSNINYIKRLDLIIKAIALLSNDKKIKWIHIGWGELADEIIQLSKELLGSKGNISYNFLGAKSNKEVIEFYRKNPVDLFINASDNEGIPVSIMEAMSFGIPCIARAVGGNPEIIRDGISGYLLKKDASPLDIAKLLEKYIDDESFRIKHAKVLEYFYNNYLASCNYEYFYNHIIRAVAKN